jgi:hypothetical protein
MLGIPMGHEAKKTEHSGSKKGNGSYWGRKRDAKMESNKKRRKDGKQAIEDTDLSNCKCIGCVPEEWVGDGPPHPYDKEE